MKKITLVIVLAAVLSCREKSDLAIRHFPAAVDSIFQKSCATEGCHIPDEHDFAKKSAGFLHLPSELDLSTWDGAFKGADNGAVIVPFASSHSHLIQHIRGSASPRMPPNYVPYNLDTLAQAQVNIISNWIDEGAMSEEGDIAFMNSKRKIFVTNQITDVVTVIDQATQLEMRVFEIGDRANLSESPHGLEITKNGKSFFVSMIVTGDIFKYDATDGSFQAKHALTSPVALIKLSQDEQKLFVTTNFQVNNTGQNGKISILRTSDLSEIKQIDIGKSPHGIQISRDGKYLYATAVYSDRIFVIDTQKDSLVTFFDIAADVGPSAKYEPYHIATYVLSNADEVLFVTCRKTNELRIYNRTGTGFILMDSIAVGKTPIQCDITPDGNKVFVVNSADSSISVIKRNSSGKYALETTIVAQTRGNEIHRLSQPNGIVVSADGKYVYVTNRNKNGAVIPHHGGSGGPGLLTIINALTNEIVKTIELEPDAYSVKTWN